MKRYLHFISILSILFTKFMYNSYNIFFLVAFYLSVLVILLFFVTCYKILFSHVIVLIDLFRYDQALNFKLKILIIDNLMKEI